MNKSIVSVVLLFFIITALSYNLFTVKENTKLILKLDENFDDLYISNKDLDSYMDASISYSNFDNIEKKINNINKSLSQIEILLKKSDLHYEKLMGLYAKLSEINNHKIKHIEQLASYKAVLNNSFRFLLRLYQDMNSKEFHDLFLQIEKYDRIDKVSLDSVKDMVNKTVATTQKEKLFILHTNTILNYLELFNNLKKKTIELKVHESIKNFELQLDQLVDQYMGHIEKTVILFIFLLFIFIIIYLISASKIAAAHKNLSRFKTAVESSDNIIIVTDHAHKIKYVNDSFIESTGYKIKEILGKTPAVLKSGKQSDEFYDKLHKTIKSGQKWFGEIINYDKNGNLRYYKSSIVPIMEKGKIIEYIAIKLDVTDDILKTKQINEKDKILAQQTKMAAMGEMLENIAHQWRQPLSAISTSATGLIVQKQLQVEVTDEEMIKTLTMINNSSNYLSETINSFRNFFKSETVKKEFNIKHSCEQALEFVISRIEKKEIILKQNLENVTYFGLETELMQVIMNLFNNACDILEEKEYERHIFVELHENGDEITFSVKDNGGGVPVEILTRIFEPYFTTKHKSQGTGIGLYMSREIVHKHLNGELNVSNETYSINGKEFTGALFTITLYHSKENEEVS